MQRLVLERTISSPSVDLDPESCILSLSGESYPENAYAFFLPITQWVREYLEGRPNRAILELRLSYLNTSSVKSLMDLLDLFEEAHVRQISVELRWYYDEENDRSRELAEEFKEDFSFPFHILPQAFPVKAQP